MGLLTGTHLAFLAVLLYGVQLRSVDSKPKYARYCGSDLASELERRCRTRGYNGPEQKNPYLLFQEKKVQTVGTERSKEIDIIEECCISACTEEFLDSYCLSSNHDDDTTVESETVETTTIIGKKRTKKPKPPRESGKKQKGGSDTNAEESTSNTDWGSQTVTPKNKKNKNKDKCEKKTRVKSNKQCRRKSRNRGRKQRRRNKPTRRPKRWDSETTTLSDFLLNQRFLQGAYDSDIVQSNVDESTTRFDVIPDGDISSSLSQEEPSSNQVISDAQRTEHFRPPYMPADTGDQSFDNNMYISSDNSRKETSSPDANPAAKLKQLKNLFSRIVHEATSSPRQT